MKILWVKAGKLLPLDTGGKIRSYNILKNLAARHEVTLLSYYVGQRDETYEAEIIRHFPHACTLNIRAANGTIFSQGRNYLLRLFSPAPYAVSKFTDVKIQRMLVSWFGAHRFDMAVCDFLAASLNFPPALPTPCVLFQHNVEGQLWRRRAFWERHWLKKAVYGLEAAKMVRYERDTVSRFHHVIAVSEHDRQQMMSMTDPSRVTVVPTGVDVEQFRPHAGADTKRPLVVFAGSMDWEPNIDGVEFFCREIWPLVRGRVAAAQFRIVGRDPHRRVRNLASPSVEVTGTVTSVIDHLCEAAVVVVPLRIGGGTRLKIFEAMAMGKAVVSTSIGAEGLEVHPDRDIILADDPAGFADAVIKLLTDLETRRKVEAAAAELAARYDWASITKRFEEVLEHVAGQASEPSNRVAGRASVAIS